VTLVIVDIDGSVSDWKPRDKAVGGNPGRGDMVAYKAYVEQLMDDSKIINDKPVPGMQELVRSLSGRDGIEIVYLTGRAERHRLVTARWLLLNRFPEAHIVMRGGADWTTSAEYKMRHVFRLQERYNTILAIEDEPEVVEAMRRAGVTVLQVVYSTSEAT
jgi:beta-phosphoglucomutase-like phosphatase (HAD superfamily)